MGLRYIWYRVIISSQIIENNIKLIIIPALNKITPKEMLASVLEDEIERLNIAINQ
jgi:hypothetical protein